MSGHSDNALRGGEALHEIASLALAQDVRVNREDGARLIAQVLRDLVHGDPEAEPRGGGVPSTVRCCS